MILSFERWYQVANSGFYESFVLFLVYIICRWYETTRDIAVNSLIGCILGVSQQILLLYYSEKRRFAIWRVIENPEFEIDPKGFNEQIIYSFLIELLFEPFRSSYSHTNRGGEKSNMSLIAQISVLLSFPFVLVMGNRGPSIVVLVLEIFSSRFNWNLSSMRGERLIHISWIIPLYFCISTLILYIKNRKWIRDDENTREKLFTCNGTKTYVKLRHEYVWEFYDNYPVHEIICWSTSGNCETSHAFQKLSSFIAGLLPPPDPCIERGEISDSSEESSDPSKESSDPSEESSDSSEEDSKYFTYKFNCKSGSYSQRFSARSKYEIP